MDMFGPNHYVPVLLTKAGERDALAEIDDARKSQFAPLFVVHPIDWDFDLDQPKKTVDEHLSKLPTALLAAWGKHDAFVDVLHIDQQIMADGRHPLEWIVAEAATIGLPLVPVISPSRSEGCIEAARNLLTAGSCTDLCLRLEAEHWPVPPQSEEIDALIAAIGTERSAVHLVIDLRDDTAAPSRFALTAALQSLIAPGEWKTLTVTATSTPKAPPPNRGLHEYLRQEWVNYRDLVVNARYGDRQPTYGDYGIAHPDPFEEINPRFLQIAAKLKYTCDEKWLVGKGELFKATGGRSAGGEAIRAVARAISVHNEFTTGHCGSEDWILAAASDGPVGNPQTWVKVGTRHHLLRVLDQIESS
ncbi:Uncharacterised protein [Mycolicibacterium phlei]|uniref:beta family protein n=1 Tax=Mycobacteroides chelonae TaxID=1774 RepID=UPI000618A89E|nr:beta family protein [Mycobacteroides chelonae]VEG15317.1 Uncharacterised protein [Mycolicibacterium phlei]AKC38117.1 hypothetical protein GR01_05365 [Mycobacteroides chelonae]ANB00812.1 hypothetical protein BB28_05795 [Mycobacteroides chelonae CCUG 47445]OLT75540.1 hypothetical protein BKG56_17765 [Mycobacteroides chelonae]ORV13198.1 hypothetical protein AWB96_18005 [Mycobacteroides chelonae]